VSTAGASDVAAKDRIVDQAIRHFAASGFGASLRSIAEAAGVTAPLITFHFGTKAALREACDAEVLRRYSELKLGAIASPAASAAVLDDTREASVLAVYMVRCFQDPGPAATRFFDGLLAHMTEVREACERAGLVKPTADPAARNRLLASSAIGSMLVEFALNPPAQPELFWDQMQERTHALHAQLELYTEGLMVDGELLATFRAATFAMGAASPATQAPATQAPAPASPATAPRKSRAAEGAARTAPAPADAGRPARPARPAKPSQRSASAQPSDPDQRPQPARPAESARLAQPARPLTPRPAPASTPIEAARQAAAKLTKPLRRRWIS
jgi:AcrR family transcriptional regulator